MAFLKVYFVALITFLTIDMIWLLVVAKDLYSKELGFLMRQPPNLLAAILFYLIFIVGLVVFVINPALEKDSFRLALAMGMLFGFVTYSTYDLTNLATVENWPVRITIIDLIWGTALGGMVSVITFGLTKMLWKH